MKNLRNSLSQPVNGKFAAILIGIAAIVLPFYFGLFEINWENAKLNWITILVLSCYAAFIIGFMLLALGRKGKDIISEATDRKISIAYSELKKKLVPLWWFIGIAWFIWVVYLAWSVYLEFKKA